MLIKRSELKWFAHLIRMPPRCLLVEVFWAYPTERRPQGRLRTNRRDYISWLAWKCLGVIPLDKQRRRLRTVSLGFSAWVSALMTLLLIGERK